MNLVGVIQLTQNSSHILAEELRARPMGHSSQSTKIIGGINIEPENLSSTSDQYFGRAWSFIR